MEQATNDLRQAKAQLGVDRLELETAELEFAESKTNLKTAETNRNEMQWKFFNGEVSRCSAMVTSATAVVTSAEAMVLKLTLAPGTYSLPPPHAHIKHNPALLTSFLSLLPPLRRHSSLASKRLV